MTKNIQRLVNLELPDFELVRRGLRRERPGQERLLKLPILGDIPHDFLRQSQEIAFEIGRVKLL